MVDLLESAQDIALAGHRCGSLCSPRLILRCRCCDGELDQLASSKRMQANLLRARTSDERGAAKRVRHVALRLPRPRLSRRRQLAAASCKVPLPYACRPQVPESYPYKTDFEDTVDDERDISSPPRELGILTPSIFLVVNSIDGCVACGRRAAAKLRTLGACSRESA